MTDTKRALYCPACGAEMRKVFVKSANCYLDVCLDGCGGIYFDNEEFDKINQAQAEIPELVDALKDKHFMLVDTEKARMCPDCSHIMIKSFSSQNNEVEVDTCKNCGGVFLDCNELFQIRNQDINSVDLASTESDFISQLDNSNESDDDKKLIKKLFKNILASIGKK